MSAGRLSAAPPPKIRVLYIGGASRSGSSLLAAILGELPMLTNVGELRFIFTRGLESNGRCDCGRRFRECDFWKAVGEASFGGWHEIDLTRAADLARTVDRQRSWPYLLKPKLNRRFARDLADYRSLMERVYRGISCASGAATIVDASKAPQYLAIVAGLQCLDLRLLHLVRDSRGVAHSLTKALRWTEPVGGRTHTGTRRPARTSLDWLVDNLLIHALAIASSSYRRIRYESLIEDPARELTRVLSFLGLGASAHLPFTEQGRVRIVGGQHAFSGNPGRVSRGDVILRLDQAWTAEMSTPSKGVVTALTAPLLSAYGYDLVK